MDDEAVVWSLSPWGLGAGGWARLPRLTPFWALSAAAFMNRITWQKRGGEG